MSDPLFIDVYAGDLDGKPDWSKLVAAGPPWHGALLKATEGLYYKPPWFKAQWETVREAAGARFGVDFFRGAYHYLRIGLGAEEQARFFLDFIKDAGGLQPTDLIVVDVERANNQPIPPSAVVVDHVYRFARAVEQATGKQPILYGGELLASLGVTSHMGCRALWIARYSPTLPMQIVNRIGWDVKDLAAWQYCGDGEAYLDGYPHVSPLGKVDISAIVAAGGGDAALAWLRDQA